jgi:hypothetical protein
VADRIESDERIKLEGLPFPHQHLVTDGPQGAGGDISDYVEFLIEFATRIEQELGS